MREKKPINWKIVGDVLMTALTVLAVFGIIWLSTEARNQVQEQRKYTVRTSCEDTNTRNRNTKAIVNREYRNRDTRIVMLLIDALAPYQNCEARVKRLVPD